MEQKPFLSELTENQIIIRDTIRDFAEKNIRPVIMEYDESQKFPMEIMKQLGELGFLGILVPEEYGGAGLGYVEYAIIIEELSKVDPSIGLSVAAHNGLCTNHINLFGNDAQKKKYLPDLASGKKIGAWGLTESFSGSDAAGLKSIAVKDGNNWILNGSKQFTTHGTVGETYVVMAITNKDAKKKGISAFILEKGMEGLIIGKKENKLGMRASDTTQLSFENCKVPAENLLGEEGMGFIQFNESSGRWKNFNCCLFSWISTRLPGCFIKIFSREKTVWQTTYLIFRQYNLNLPRWQQILKRQEC